MSQVEVILVRVLPSKPVDPKDFVAALGLISIELYDLSLKTGNNGRLIGIASGVISDASTTLEIGTLADRNNLSVLKDAILPHADGIDPIRIMASPPTPCCVATALVLLNRPTDEQEFPTRDSFDIRIRLTAKNGIDISNPADYNISGVERINLDDFALLRRPQLFEKPAAGYLFLPEFSSLNNPAGDAGQVRTGPDGMAPPFKSLLDAINRVLEKEDVSLEQRTTPLSQAECVHIASELAWNRTTHPPPDDPSPQDLSQWYTNGKTSDQEEQRRQKFEGQLKAYEAALRSEALRLSNFIYSLSAALEAEKRTWQATKAAFTFPINTPESGALDTSVATGTVVVAGQDSVGTDFKFAVPAAFFYALSTPFSPGISIDQRYEAALITTESRLVAQIQAAIEAGVISESEKFLSVEPTKSINTFQCARRIVALGGVNPSLRLLELSVPAPDGIPSVSDIITGWLAFSGTQTQMLPAFWEAKDGVIVNHAQGYLALVLWFVTRGSRELITTLMRDKPQGLGLKNVDDLTAVTDSLWKQFFGVETPSPGNVLVSQPYPNLLPAFLQIGDLRQRVQAWIIHLERFFAVSSENLTTTPSQITFVSAFQLPTSDLLSLFISAYSKAIGKDAAQFTFADKLEPNLFTQAISSIFPRHDQERERKSLTRMVEVISNLYKLTQIGKDDVQFSLMESLYARGVLDIVIVASASLSDLQNALRGTVAFGFASQIYAHAQTITGLNTKDNNSVPVAKFCPINPDGHLINFIPQEHLSPFGQIQYLHELFHLVTDPTDLASILGARRGALGMLLANTSNSSAQIPRIDIVNENLEALASHPSIPTGQIYNTDSELSIKDYPRLAAMPENSSPAALVKSTTAYENLRKSFDSPALPYSQFLDINRSYLRQIGTTRLQVLRTFQRDTTDFPMATTEQTKPVDFEANRWQLPCHLNAALEYIGVSHEEYEKLYSGNKLDPDQLRILFGFTNSPAASEPKPATTNIEPKPAPTDFEPKSTPPSQPIEEQPGTTAPEWDPSQHVYAIGDIVRYKNELFQARQSHMSQPEWWPGGPVAALWSRPTPEGKAEWQVNTHYIAGSIVTYLGKSYSCISEHTSDAPDWTPVLAPALWVPSSVSTSPPEVKPDATRIIPPPLDPIHSEPGTEGEDWTKTVLKLSEFLSRTGLSYPEFVEFANSQFLGVSSSLPTKKFPVTEPRCLRLIRIVFDGTDVIPTLRRAIIFIRLWRSIRESFEAGINFSTMAKICIALKLFADVDGTPNSDFIRQLASLLMMNEYMQIPLDFLLSLYSAQPSGLTLKQISAKFVEHVEKWLVSNELCQIRRNGFDEVLADNLDVLSRLSGFLNAENYSDNWYDLPTNTIRFFEVVSHVYESNFTIGSLALLFTASPDLPADNPFPFQNSLEATQEPLHFPQGSDYDLWELRKSLLGVDVKEAEAKRWTWPRMLTLIEKFGYTNVDAIRIMAEHFFPAILETGAQVVSKEKRRFYADLTVTDASMWIAPFEFASKKLSFQLPLKDEDFLNTLRESRALLAEEQQAIQNLYFAPRAMLAPFAPIFEDFNFAVNFLINTDTDQERWEFFQMQFVKFYHRTMVVAGHLAQHAAYATFRRDCSSTDVGMAWTILCNILADENYPKDMAKGWEILQSEGTPSTIGEFLWEPKLSGSAFAALLGLVGTGLTEEYYLNSNGKQELAWRTISSKLSSFGNSARNEWNVPVPTMLPPLEPSLELEDNRYVTVRNGIAIRDYDGLLIGGTNGFEVHWKGFIVFDESKQYVFRARTTGQGSDFADEENCHRDCQSYWTVNLKRGSRTWPILHHGKEPRSGIPTQYSRSHLLQKGAYEIEICFWQATPEFTNIGYRDNDVQPCHTGFQLEYKIAGEEDDFVTVRQSMLFAQSKSASLATGVPVTTGTAAHNFLQDQYYSTIRDIRRTYQRAFKAVALSLQFQLSAEAERQCNGLSELQFLLANASQFAGKSYYRNDKKSRYVSHVSDFNFNLIPVYDPFDAPSTALDSRAYPSPQRQAALFDWFERLFQYSKLRFSLKPLNYRKPLWTLFYEAKTQNAPSAAQLLLHLGIDVSAAPIALNYLYALDTGIEQSLTLAATDLSDERWAYRVWKAGQWIQVIQKTIYARKIERASPALWAASTGTLSAAPQIGLGNYSLVKFVSDAFLDTESDPAIPTGLKDLTVLNNALRERARASLVAYLCSGNKVSLQAFQSHGFAQSSSHLSNLLLIDADCHIDETTTRIQDAIQAIQMLVERATLHLESHISLSSEFANEWKTTYASFPSWQSWKRRTLYSENWIHFQDMKRAKQHEYFQLLEAELKRDTNTVSSPAASKWWDSGTKLPSGGPFLSIQDEQAAKLNDVSSDNNDGFELVATPQFSGRPSLVMGPVKQQDRAFSSNLSSGHSTVAILTPTTDDADPILQSVTEIPLWVRTAINIGTRFIRIAAAGPPPPTSFPADWTLKEADHGYNSTDFASNSSAPGIDEYWFWISDGSSFQEQDAIRDSDIGSKSNLDSTSTWDSPEGVPKLLQWKANATVYLNWSRVHQCRFDPPARSEAGIDVSPKSSPQLKFIKRAGDSLVFAVAGSLPQLGLLKAEFNSVGATGFSYSMPDDLATVVPEVATAPSTAVFPASLTSYPFFIYHSPGVPYKPAPKYSVGLTLATALRARGSWDLALQWCQLEYDPLLQNNQWAHCNPDEKAEKDIKDSGSGFNMLSYCSHLAQDSETARKRAITLLYLETLLEKATSAISKADPDSCWQAQVTLDCIENVLGSPPDTLNSEDLGLTTNNVQTVKDFVSSSASLNPRLLAIYDEFRTRKDRLRHLVSDFHVSSLNPCDDFTSVQSPARLYRFKYLFQKALDVVSMVRDTGYNLLQALEKGDGEYLASLQAMHEKQIQALTLDVRQNEWRESDWQLQALEKRMESAQTSLRYTLDLLARGVNSYEHAYEGTNGTSIGFKASAAISDGISESTSVVPDMWFGGAGMMGSPMQFNQLPVGSKLGQTFAAGARIFNTLGDSFNTLGEMLLTKSEWDRREDDWRNEVNTTSLEIEQTKREMLAAKRRCAISLRELNMHQRQIENSQEIHEFLRDKFSKQDLYLFLQTETASIYRQAYNLATAFARDALQALLFERGFTSLSLACQQSSTIQSLVTTLSGESWASMREGLMAGERLDIALRYLERDYLSSNAREFELSKNISLRSLFPIEYLLLKQVGKCQITLPEWLFDLDYPGHYMRRIKSIKITISAKSDAIASAGVRSRLRLLSSIVRTSPRLHRSSKSNQETIRDPSVRKHYYHDPQPECQMASMIVTSFGNADSGMFDPNPSDDERYLPFEYCGIADSTWSIELPPENNIFDIRAIDDFVIQVNYTARDGGQTSRDAAWEKAQSLIPERGLRFLDARVDLEDSWMDCFGNLADSDDNKRKNDHSTNARSCAMRYNHDFAIEPHYYRSSHVRSLGVDASKSDLWFNLRLPRSSFPFVPAQRFEKGVERKIVVTRVDIFIETVPKKQTCSSDSANLRQNLDIVFLSSECCAPHRHAPAVIRCDWGDNTYHGIISFPPRESGNQDASSDSMELSYIAGSELPDALDLGDVCFPRGVIAEEMLNDPDNNGVQGEESAICVRNLYFVVMYRIAGLKGEMKKVVTSRQHQKIPQCLNIL